LRTLIRQRVFGRLRARARQSPLAKDVALPVQELIRVEQTAAVPLLVGALTAIVWVNSPWRATYTSFWGATLSLDLGIVAYEDDLAHWVSNLLMPLFFFVIGLEIKREIVHGILRQPSLSALPIATAIGGVVVPILIYFLIDASAGASSAWGVVVATDIAFALAVLRLAGGKIPATLATLILAFAIIDDAIGVLIIAIFYSSDVSLGALGMVALFLGLIVLCRRFGIWSLTVYLILGCASWIAMVDSGIHPTILGVALGLLTPVKPLFRRTEATDLIAHVSQRLQAMEDKRAAASRGSVEFQRLEEKEETIFGYLEIAIAGSEAPAERLIRWLNPWVGYLVLPVFALANAGVDLSPDALRTATESRTGWATVAALVIGKPIGIALFAIAALRLGLARLPRGLGVRHIGAMGVVGGIGFTVSLFIADLALSGSEQLDAVKLAVLAASLFAGVAGWMLLRLVGAERALA